MKDILGDIRILKLAEMYERAYEGFVLEMATRYVRDPQIKKRLEALVSTTDGHGERIAAELARLSALVGEDERESVERAALLDVLEVERSARGFYLRFVEEVHDPLVADLFRDLAREEGAHVRIAEDALAQNDKRSGRPRLSAETQRMLRMLAEGVDPLGADWGTTKDPPS